MFIEFISIVRGDGKELRRVSFHSGANLVVDSEESARHNKVGKTTFLRLIDVLLGAKDRKLIYTDSETSSVNEELKNFIEKENISIEGRLTNELPSGKSSDILFLKVDLRPRGQYYIDGQHVGYKEYVKRLNERIFDNEGESLSFRQLIHFFVRIALTGDDNAFLHCIHGSRTGNKTYRAAYNHLLGISGSLEAQKLDEVERNLRSAKTTLKRYCELHSLSTSENLQQVLSALQKDELMLRHQLDDIIEADEFVKNRDLIIKTRQQYNEITDEISELDYLITRNEKALSEARTENRRKVDSDLTREFFQEVSELIPQVEEKFEEMIRFNNQLSQNRISFFEDNVILYKDERIRKVEERARLIEGEAKYLSVVKDCRIDEYLSLFDEHARMAQEAGEKKALLATLKSYEQERDGYESEVTLLQEQLKARQVNYRSVIDDFNDNYFTPVAMRVNGEKPLLVYNTEQSMFPVALERLNEGTSTGTRKSLIAAYDLAYQDYAKHIGIKVPHFVVHDVLESVEGEDLKATLEEANSQASQYIVAVLKEKLDSSGIDEEEQRQMIVLELSDKDRLFEGRSECAKSEQVQIPPEEGTLF